MPHLIPQHSALAGQTLRKKIHVAITHNLQTLWVHTKADNTPYHPLFHKTLQAAHPKPLKSSSKGNTICYTGHYILTFTPPGALALAAPLHHSTPWGTGFSSHLPLFVSLGLIDNPPQLTSLRESTRSSPGERLQPQAGKKQTTNNKPQCQKPPNQTEFYMPFMLHAHHR